MANLKQNNKTSKLSPYTFLDKLEVTMESGLTKSAVTLYNTGLSRHNTIKKVNRILEWNPTEEIYNKYAPALNCSKVVLQEGNHLNMMRCKKKFCQTCSRIKTGDMINGYKDNLEALGVLYMVTLTAPTVEGRQLKSEIKKRIKAFQRIKDRLRKQSIKLHGMRKLECTFTNGKFHPHFHFMQLGKYEAEMLLAEWLKEFPTAGIKGQDITLVEGKGSFKELFKYNAKEVIKNEDIPASALHTIYKAFEGVRNFQAYGKVKKAKRKESESNDRLISDFMPINDQYQYEVYVYKYNYKTWLSSSNKQLININEITFKLLNNTKARNKITNERNELKTDKKRLLNAYIDLSKIDLN